MKKKEEGGERTATKLNHQARPEGQFMLAQVVHGEEVRDIPAWAGSF